MKFLLVFIVAQAYVVQNVNLKPVCVNNDDRLLLTWEEIKYYMESSIEDLNFTESDNESFTKGVQKYGDLFQGDINFHYLNRVGLSHSERRWEKINGKVIVPYVLDFNVSSISEMFPIKAAMAGFKSTTCVQFVYRTNQTDYIRITSDNGCNSYIGKVGGEQKLSLEKGGCYSRATIQHELIHALGFTHMQNHEDRDKFVEIIWENIEDKYKSNFDKVSSDYFENFGTSYDLSSIMHYDTDAFSKNKLETIVPREESARSLLGKSKSMSEGDIERINKMYNCTI